MEKYKYVRLNDGEIFLANEFNNNQIDSKYCEDIMNLLEVDDLVRIEYFSPKEDKTVQKLFQVEFISDDKYYIVLKNAYMNFIINHEELNPTIKSIVTKEKIKKNEYDFSLKKQDTFDLPIELREMALGLVELYDIAYKEIKPCVYNIINNHVRNIVYIEHTLDNLLNIPYEPCYQLFFKLCEYVSTFDKECADDYLEIFEELYGEEPKEKKKIK